MKVIQGIVLIECLRESQRYRVKRLLKMFPDRLWNLSGLRKLIGKINGAGKADRRPASQVDDFAVFVSYLRLLFVNRLIPRFKSCYQNSFVSNKHLQS